MRNAIATGSAEEEGAESQNEATHSLLRLLVQPLEARGNQVDMFVTETSGVGSPCPLVRRALASPRTYTSPTSPSTAVITENTFF